MRLHPFAVAATLSFVPANAWADVPAVVTDIAVVQSLVQTVMGDLGTVAVLVPPGASAHSYQMRPSDAAALQHADVVFWVGEALSPWLGRVAEGTGLKAKTIELLGVPGTTLRAFGEDADHDHFHASAQDLAAPAEGAHDDHNHDGVDPHAWLDPANARAWLAAMATALAAADPANAVTYAANAAAATQQVAALDAELAALLAPLAGHNFVVFHDAYGYFTDHYGLAVAGSLSLGDASASGAAHLSDLRNDLLAGGVVCAFPEAGQDTSQLAVMLEGTSVRLGAPLDPTGSLFEGGTGHYGATMRGLAASLVNCLAPR